MVGGRAQRHRGDVTLFWRVVAINVGVLVVATLVLALSPATVSSSLTATEIAVLTGGVLVVAAVNVVMLRRVFVPLERLADLMRRVDLLGDRARVDLDRGGCLPGRDARAEEQGCREGRAISHGAPHFAAPACAGGRNRLSSIGEFASNLS